MKERPILFRAPMVRAASRIDLEIVSVRAEELQEITEADARAEGVEPMAPRLVHGHVASMSCRETFAALWMDLHGPASWEANPWVWVVEFKRIRP